MPKPMFWRLPVALLAVIAVLVLSAARVATAAIVDIDAERSTAVDTAQTARCGGRS